MAQRTNPIPEPEMSKKGFKGFTLEYITKMYPQEATEQIWGNKPTKGRNEPINVPMKPKRAKYGNKKVETSEGRFDSKKEYGRWLELKQMKQAGEISDLILHPEFKIEINGKKVCTYFADFSYRIKKNGYVFKDAVVEDVKSAITSKNPVYRLKKKLVKAVWGIEISEV